MNLYKIYNLPIYNHHIGKSLKYQLEGTNLAITKDNKYATILSDMEFIRCTLADGHFCDLNTGLYHVDTNQRCVTTMFFKDNEKISTYCRVTIHKYNWTKASVLFLLRHPPKWKSSVKTTAMLKLYNPLLLSSTCNQHAVHFPLLSNFHLILSSIQKVPSCIEVCKPPYPQI